MHNAHFRNADISWVLSTQIYVSYETTAKPSVARNVVKRRGDATRGNLPLISPFWDMLLAWI